jgi:hypothetical protein
MFYELREYDIYPERWDEYLVWAETRAFPLLFDKLHFPLVGFWRTVAQEDDAGSTATVLCILAWQSEEELLEKWSAYFSSPQYKVIWAEATDPATGKPKFHRQTRSTFLHSLPITGKYHTLLPQ